MNLSGLGNIYPGYQQGVTDQQGIQQRAQQIQNTQLQIDAAKRALAADAAAAQSLTQPGSNISNLPQGANGPLPPPPQAPPQPGPQPPPPGQASMPAQPPQPQMQPPPAAAAQSPIPAAAASAPPQPQGQPAPQAQPPAGAPAPQAQPAPQPQQPAGGAPQGQQQPGGQGGGFAGSAQDPQMMLHNIVMQIKKANPNIDGPTLLAAADRQIGMMKGLDNDAKTQLQAELQVQKLTAQAAMEIQKAQSQAEVAEIKANTAGQIAALYAAQRDRASDNTLKAREDAISAANTRAANADTRIREMQDKSLNSKQLSADQKVRAAAANEKFRTVYATWNGARAKVQEYEATGGGMMGQGITADGYQKSLKTMQQADKDMQGLWKAFPTAVPNPKDLTGDSAGASPASDGGGQAAPDKPQAAALPKDLPDPKGHAEGSVAKDGQGKTVAKIKNGQWVAP